jgi:hypothetical protein
LQRGAWGENAAPPRGRRAAAPCISLPLSPSLSLSHQRDTPCHDLKGSHFLMSCNFHSCKKTTQRLQRGAFVVFGQIPQRSFKLDRTNSSRWTPRWQGEHPTGKPVPLKLGDSCCGLLRGAVQPDLRCTLGPLELTFDLCPGCRPRDATVSPSGWTRAEGLWSPRELRMSNQHELEQTTTVPIRRRVALSGHLSPHRNTQHSLHQWSPPPPVLRSTCTCLNTPG